jgi:uncharacterized protein (DUF1697 family)
MGTERAMATCIALLRGINVGKAKRIAMAELRALFAGLGHRNVRTLLNSGNVVFDAARADTHGLARDIGAAIERRCGFSAEVIVVTADELGRIVHENPLQELLGSPSQFLVAFVAEPRQLDRFKPLERAAVYGDRLAVGRNAAYLWCARGILTSDLAKAFLGSAGEGTTTRNWATVLKLQAAAAPRSAGA